MCMLYVKLEADDIVLHVTSIMPLAAQWYAIQNHTLWQHYADIVWFCLKKEKCIEILHCVSIAGSLCKKIVKLCK